MENKKVKKTNNEEIAKILNERFSSTVLLDLFRVDSLKRNEILNKK